jgi:hypothetical protein
VLIRHYHPLALALSMLSLGGPAQKIPQKKKFLAGGLNFQSTRKDKKADRPQTKRGSFFNNSIIALPNACHFVVDPQPRWVTRSKFGDPQGTLNQFRRALMIATFCFCCSCS